MKIMTKRMLVGMAASIAVGATVIGSTAPTYALSNADQKQLKSKFRSSTNMWKAWRNNKQCKWFKDCYANTSGYRGGNKYVIARIVKSNGYVQATSGRVWSTGDKPAYTKHFFIYNNPDTTKYRANKDFGTAKANYNW